MFTGIIETMGRVVRIETDRNNLIFYIEASIKKELKIDQSLAHNGVCLTVDGFEESLYRVTAIAESLQKTNLGKLKPGSLINLERCMPANGRFDGHIVQGHVDQTGKVSGIRETGGSWEIDFEYDPDQGHITVEKGSITINGVSLTCFNVAPGRFSVAIIPYTWEHTNFHQLKVGNTVNLEFDILGKYVQAMLLGGYRPK